MSCVIDSRGLVYQYAMSGDQPAFRQSTIALFTSEMGYEKPLSAQVGDSVAWASLIASILLMIGSLNNRSKVDEETSM
jgi:hypothetical protein